MTAQPAPISRRLSRRSLLIAALGAPALVALVAACGDDDTIGSTGSTTDETTADTAATTAAASSGGIEHPTGPDDVVLRYGLPGGFTMAGFAFTNVPQLLVTGNGRLITPGVTTMIYPGPLLPALTERTISEEGIQKLLQLADTAGLLAPAPDYEGNILVADAPDTLVEITANGETYTHRAPALGFDEVDESDARRALRTFTELLGDLTKVVGAENLGEEGELVAESYRIQATSVTAEEFDSYEQRPTVVDWTVAGVSLADASECLVVPAAAAGPLLTEANQDTLFRELPTDPTTTAVLPTTVPPGVVGPASLFYRVAAVALLPGDVCG